VAANVLTNYIQPLLAMGLQEYRNAVVLPRLVNRTFEPTPGTKMSTIEITIPSAMAAVDVTPAHTAPDTQAILSTKKSITIDKWKEAPFTMNDRELMQVSHGIIPAVAREAILALVEAVEADLFDKAMGIPYMSGTAGTTPFAVSSTTGLNDMTVYIGARKGLNVRKAPATDRFSIIDPDAAGNLLNGRQFTDAAWRGDTGGIIQGAIGYKLGANWLESNRVTTSTSTPLTAGAATVNGVNAAGATSVSIAKATNAAPLVRGNTLTIATGAAAGTYRVKTSVSLIVGNTTVELTTPLLGATAGGESVTLLATSVQNLLIHRDALAFVTRPLGESIPPGAGSPGFFDYIVDPESGLVLRLELTREHKQWRWSYDIMWGSELIRPEFGHVMLG